MKITRNRIDDETVEYELNGQTLAYLTHDEHGWDGMQAVEDVINQFADVLDVKIKDIGH
jgi:hypothetical protein